MTDEPADEISALIADIATMAPGVKGEMVGGNWAVIVNHAGTEYRTESLSRKAALQAMVDRLKDAGL